MKPVGLRMDSEQQTRPVGLRMDGEQQARMEQYIVAFRKATGDNITASELLRQGLELRLSIKPGKEN